MAAGDVTNHFVHVAAAERYHRHRPYFHPRVIDAIRTRLALAQSLPVALDVGCGTGHSAMALRAIADRVVAVDGSEAMLAAAPAVDGIDYLCAQAETLPFTNSSFPLITVSMAFHWFDRDRFLAEAVRLLEPGGWLVLYGYNYTKVMSHEPGFPEWVKGSLLKRYPLTSRNGTSVTEPELAAHGLTLRERTEFDERRDYGLEEYTQHILTHSYVINRVDGGGETLEEAAQWIRGGLAPFFRGAAVRKLEFSGWITWVQKEAQHSPAV